MLKSAIRHWRERRRLRRTLSLEKKVIADKTCRTTGDHQTPNTGTGVARVACERNALATRPT